MSTRQLVTPALFVTLVLSSGLSAGRPAEQSAPPPAPPQGQAPPGGRGPGAAGQEVKLVDQFDKNRDGWLNAAERRAARDFMAASPQPAGRRGGGRGAPQGPAQAGPKLTPKDVSSGGRADIYALDTLRTFFLEFEAPDWEDELRAFNNTDVDVPATVTVDGRTYRDVGVHFRGASSFFGVAETYKRALNLTFDFVHEGQQLGTYRTFNLLNSHTDPTFVRSVLYLQVAREYLPAAKANFVRVVINGESWGIYPSVQQFNRDFLRDFYKTTDGARWQVPGSPGGRGGLEYLGDDVEPYKRTYELKTRDNAESWNAFITLCRVLNTTPADKLEAALSPILDIDGALRFLALDNVFVNNDGYWTRASDYSLYRDTRGRFHLVPHDTNETFPAPRPARAGGPGGPGGPPPGAPPRGQAGGQPPPPGFDPARGQAPPPVARGRAGGPGGAELDPLIGIEDATKPLRSKLLAVPALRARYMAYVKDMATKWLDWARLEPIVTRHQRLIAADVAADTRKLESTEAFTQGVEGLKAFAAARRAYLLSR